MATQSSREQLSGSSSEHWKDRAQQRMEQSYQGLTECVTNHPASSVLTMFGVGFGLGVLIGYALAGPAPRRTPWYDLQTAERFGRQMLDSISSALPSAISSRLPG